MSKFKEGDVVRCILGSVGGDYKLGREYVVRDTAENGTNESIRTIVDSRGNPNNGWGVENFELAEPRVITNTPRAGESAEQTAARSAPRKTPALQTQIGGSHYTDMKIQPIEYILANNIPFPEGNVIKYVSRWRNKGGLKDVKKAIHHMQLLVEYEESIGTA